MIIESSLHGFHDLLDVHAQLTPNAPAIICDDEKLTYADLADRANRLAHALIEAGVRPESLVGICTERSIDMIVGVIAILKAGGAYVPLDPAYPQERLAYMLEDSAIRLVLTQSSTTAVLPINQARHIVLDTFDYAAYPLAKPTVEIAPDNLAYVIYTSGTTGRPKGVMVEHRNLTSFAEWTQARFTAAQSARILASSSLSFDVSVMELTTALSSGGALVIVRNVLDLLLTPVSEPISMIVSVPSPIAELVRAGAIPPSVHTIMLGGEILSRALAAEIYATTNVKELINAWGVTEDTVVTTEYIVPVAPESDPPIGKAITDRRIHLLDAQLQPVAIGTPGEICCTGSGVARGYLNRPELSSERFVPNPFGDSPLMYRSGDQAMQAPNGEIRFLGRNDQQVKIRGFRIELGGIETVLVDHPKIAQVAIIAKTISGNTSLAMYAVERDGQKLTFAEVETFLAARLPKHMIPSTLTILKAMPLGPTGKIDRKALQQLIRERPPLGVPYIEPRNAIETTISGLFATLLGIDRVGIRDNFFAVGGQSLVAARAVAEVTQTFPQEIADLNARDGERALLNAFWRQPTIECVAAALQNIPFDDGVVTTVEGVHCLQIGSPEKLPIFILHGVLDGEAFFTWNLTHLLGTAQPVYTLPPHGLNGKPVPETIEEMAADYLAKIRQIQPHGPYQFAGYCNGGLVSYEMSRMLEAAGEKVEKLVLISAPGHNIQFEALERTMSWIPGISTRMQRMLFLRIRGRIRYLQQLMTPTPKIDASTTPETKKGMSSEALKSHVALIRAIDAYVPKPYNGEAHLLYGAEDIYFKRNTPFTDWPKIAKNLRPCLIPGDHHFIDEQPEILAKFFLD